MPTDRELDAKLAVCLGWRWFRFKPGDQQFMVAPDLAGDIDSRYLSTEPSGNREDLGRVARGVPHYSSDDAPRSVMASVEAEIERRGLTQEYADAIDGVIGEVEYDSKKFCTSWQYLTAPAAIRARAAVEVLTT